jgi:hypothetical protein
MWIETIVMPREEPAHYSSPAPRYDRESGQQSACALGQQFRDTVLSYLQSNQLMGAVKWISEPGSIPMVTLHCTSLVLEQLQKSSEFEAGRSLSLSGF